MSLADQLASDLAAWSRALGTADPVPLLFDLIEPSYDLPRDALAYLHNELSPGKVPIEISFSEAAPSCLRIDLEPWPSKMPPAERRSRLNQHVLQLAAREMGREAADRFAEVTAPWLAAQHALRFGAFFGASFDRAGLADIRIYFEHTARAGSTPLASAISGSLPILESITLSRTGSITSRTYLGFSTGLRLHDLEELARQLDLLHRFPDLFHSARALSGCLVIAPAQAIAGVRVLPDGAEIKLDVMVVPPLAEQTERALRRHLAGRPASEEAYLRWRAAVGEVRLSVISVRVSTDSSASLNVYAHPYA